MRYVAFKHEKFTHIDKETYIPLFDVELERPNDAAELLWCHVEETMLNAKFDMNVCVNNLREKGFDDDAAYCRIYEKYQIITYVVIEYGFQFLSKTAENFSGTHYEYWMQDAEKMARELKIKNVLDD